MTVAFIDQMQLHNTAVSLWRIDLSAPADAHLLSADEQARAARLVIPAKRQQFIAARVGLRRILGDHTGQHPADVRFGGQAQGKPVLYGEPSCEFNLSHSGDTALVAVADQPVGIDVECERLEGSSLADLHRMAQIAFSPQEQAAWLALPTQDQRRAFYRLWTRKEAYMKAHGEGFKLAHTFTLPLIEQTQPLVIGDCWIVDLPIAPGLIAALAVWSTPDKMSNSFPSGYNK